MREEVREGNGQGKFRPPSLPHPHCPCGSRWVSPNRKAEASPSCVYPTMAWKQGGWGLWAQLRHTQVLQGTHLSPPIPPSAPQRFQSGPWSRESVGQGILVWDKVLITGWLWVRYLMSLGFSFPFEKHGVEIYEGLHIQMSVETKQVMRMRQQAESQTTGSRGLQVTGLV